MTTANRDLAKKKPGHPGKQPGLRLLKTLPSALGRPQFAFYTGPNRRTIPSFRHGYIDFYDVLGIHLAVSGNLRVPLSAARCFRCFGRLY